MKRVVYLSTNSDSIPRWDLEIKTLVVCGYSVKLICWDRRGTLPPVEMLNCCELIRVRPWCLQKNRIAMTDDYAMNFWHSDYHGINMLPKVPFLYGNTYRALLDEPFDIIHCCHAALLPLAVFAGIRKRKDVVYDVSEFYVEQSCRALPASIKFAERFAAQVEDTLVHRMAGVVCVPSRGDALVKRYRRRVTNVAVVGNLPELRDETDEELFVQLMERYRDRRVLVYAGAISLRKHMLETVKALKTVCRKHPEVKLVLIGSCPGDDTDRIRSYVAENGLVDQIDIIDLQPHRRLQTYYRCSDVGLALMDREYAVKLTKGNSRKIVEFMKSSLPIIVPDYGEIGLIVKEESCGLSIPTCDEIALAQAINFLLDNPEKAQQMGKRGRAAFVSKYNWDIESKKFLSVYENLPQHGGCM